jgi:alpha-galactosidase
MLSKGTFLDLYVYGYDLPEGYAIEKDENMFYAFYADNKESKPAQAGKPADVGKPAEDGKSAKAGNHTGEWKGQVELRGLRARQYSVVDYVNNIDYGTVTGPNAKLHTEFKASLLLQATPVGNGPAEK